MELIEHPPILHIPAIPDHILYTWIVMAILVVVSFVATRRVSLVPTGSQNFMELVLDQFVKELDETIGHEGRRYLPLIATTSWGWCRGWWRPPPTSTPPRRAP